MRSLIRLFHRLLVLCLGVLSVWLIVFVVFDTADNRLPWILAVSLTYGLAAYVYSGDLSRALRVGKGIESGMIAINRGLMSDPAAPFGGAKQSGLGREGGVSGILEFMEPKYFAVNF